MREALIGGLVAVSFMGAVMLSISPIMWFIGKWHCYWFAAAPICQ